VDKLIRIIRLRAPRLHGLRAGFYTRARLCRLVDAELDALIPVAVAAVRAEFLAETGTPDPKPGRRLQAAA
jgi:hypothetical protein